MIFLISARRRSMSSIVMVFMMTSTAPPRRSTRAPGSHIAAEISSFSYLHVGVRLRRLVEAVGWRMINVRLGTDHDDGLDIQYRVNLTSSMRGGPSNLASARRAVSGSSWMALAN